MPKVTVHGGLTFHMGAASSNNYGRVDVTIADVDSEMPIEPQIASSVKAAQTAWDAVIREIDRETLGLAGKRAG